jgi:hypothetical protein
LIWQTLTVATDSIRDKEGVALPGGLRTLTGGSFFNRGLEGDALPWSLQTLTLTTSSRRAGKVTLPRSMQT